MNELTNIAVMYLQQPPRCLRLWMNLAQKYFFFFFFPQVFEQHFTAHNK